MSKLVRNLLLTGCFLTFFPPLIGLLLTVVSMISAFHTLGQNGIANPQALSNEIGLSLMTTATGIGVSVIGICFLFASGIAAYIESRKGRPL